MLIGQLADAAGVTAKTIRFYERIGILPPPSRTASGYRRYGSEDADRLRFIRRTQDFGLHLNEIREVVALRDHGQRPATAVQESVRDSIDHVEERIEQMRQTRGDLEELLGASDDPAAAEANGARRGCGYLPRRR